MTIIRTPEERFVNLPDYQFEPNYVQLGDTRMHYVDEGDGPLVLMLHGDPTWSFLYRHIIADLRREFRIVAPDLIGFGRSDKYAAAADYSYEMHCGKFRSFVETLDLLDVTLVVHDWGGPIGMRVATEMPERFARLVLLNTFLSTGQSGLNLPFRAWRAFARYSPILPVGLLLQAATVRWLSGEVLRGYKAPFHSRQAKAGARIFPLLVPDSRDDPAAPAMRATFRAMRRWQRPALVMFGSKDPILGGLGAVFHRLIPGAQDQPEITIGDASHFLQEDSSAEVAGHIQAFIRRS
ncbi:MAG TPA: haloalkane dehalogenase [Candidatus Binatia bacterium]|nr:haloalkane dehalogenase [Candidatus Binatia bacterium]